MSRFSLSFFLFHVLKFQRAYCSRFEQVRDFYANSNWAVFNQLVSVVAPGGSIGLDDKLFSFVYPSLEVHPFGIALGVVRFENGVHHDEYRDLRANPRFVASSLFPFLPTRD